MFENIRSETEKITPKLFLSYKWKNASDATRKKYKMIADKDTQREREEWNTFEKNHPEAYEFYINELKGKDPRKTKTKSKSKSKKGKSKSKKGKKKSEVEDSFSDDEDMEFD